MVGFLDRLRAAAPYQALSVFRTMLLIYVLSHVIGCSSLGSKSFLGVDLNNGWEAKNGEYIFRGDGVIITIPEVLIDQQTSAIGPVLPTIPLSHNVSYDFKQLEFRLTVTGFPNVTELGPDAITATTYSAGNQVPIYSARSSLVTQTTKNNAEGRLWVQYALQYSYNIRLKELERISLRIKLPMFNGAVPELYLSRKTASNNQFSLSPGP